MTTEAAVEEKKPETAATPAEAPEPLPQLDLDDIFATEPSDDTVYKEVPTPEWNKSSVTLGSLNAADSMIFAEMSRLDHFKAESMYLLVVMSMVGKQKQRVERDKDVLMARVKYLSTRNGVAVARLVDVALDINKMNIRRRTAIKNDLSEASTAASPTSSPKTEA